MPRTTKDTSNKLNKEKNKKTASNNKKSLTKKAALKIDKVESSKKETTQKAKVESSKKETTKKTKAVSSKKETTKKAKAISTKKETTKKAKAISTKKETTKKAKAVSTKKTRTTTSKKGTSKRTLNKSNSKINVLEYYDLPYRYNQTVVRVLAQTPKTLFVYWDISDEDRKLYIKNYGKDFFEKTKPVLIITNQTKNYSFEIEINDFANCWYFNVNDEKCEYLVELGRRLKENNYDYSSLSNNYLYITSSNKIESPNDHILFEKEQKTLYYRNVKTNEVYSKDIANLNYLIRMGRIYKIYDIYQKLYKDGELLNPANNPSSKFF